jgi:hypothetical protein
MGPESKLREKREEGLRRESSVGGVMWSRRE